MTELERSYLSGGDPLGKLFDELADRVSGLKGDARAAYDDLEFYSRYVMADGNREYSRNSRFISDIYQDLQYSPKDLLILGPRGSAKSTAVSITYPTWKIGRNPLIRFLLSFASIEAQGLAFIRQIKQIIEFNPNYAKVFGQLKPAVPERWTDNEIIVERPTPPSGLKDPTIGIAGIGSAVPSKRADEVICDDLVTMDNAYSEVQRDKVIRFVYQTLFPILTPHGRKIIVGSRWDPRDLYAHTADRWELEIPEPDQINFNDFIVHAD